MAHQWQINLVVLDERCAVVCRSAEIEPQFNYRLNFICMLHSAEVAEPGTIMIEICRAYDSSSDPEKIH